MYDTYRISFSRHFIKSWDFYMRKYRNIYKSTGLRKPKINRDFLLIKSCVVHPRSRAPKGITKPNFFGSRARALAVSFSSSSFLPSSPSSSSPLRPDLGSWEKETPPPLSDRILGHRNHRCPLLPDPASRRPGAAEFLGKWLSKACRRGGSVRRPDVAPWRERPTTNLYVLDVPSEMSMSEQQDHASKSSCSSISSSTQESEEDATVGTLLTEVKNNGRSLGRRLSHLDSLPHTPRVNGKIPDVNNATIDHESLLERLGTYGLAEFQIEGDGNCQFRALADQIFRNPDYHKHVRKAVVKQLKEFRKHYEGYVPLDYKVYLKKMKRSGEWGDHVTLQAAADRFGAKICLLTSFRDTCLIEIVPRDVAPTRELWLSFWCEVHYNSLYATEDLPTRRTKKKHWLF